MGIATGEFKKEINAEAMARVIFAQIEGGIFCSTLMDDQNMMIDMMDQIDNIILNEIKK